MALEDEIVEALARVGYEIERRLTEPGVALLAVLLIWVFWPTPLDAIVATCLIALAYYRHTRKKEPPPPSNHWLTALGVVLVAWGLYSLAGEYINVPWEVGLILAGIILIILGTGGGRSGKKRGD